MRDLGTVPGPIIVYLPRPAVDVAVEGRALFPGYRYRLVLALEPDHAAIGAQDIERVAVGHRPDDIACRAERQVGPR